MIGGTLRTDIDLEDPFGGNMANDLHMVVFPHIYFIIFLCLHEGNCPNIYLNQQYKYLCIDIILVPTYTDLLCWHNKISQIPVG